MKTLKAFNYSKAVAFLKVLKNIKIVLILLWTALTLSMSAWWMILILNLVEKLPKESGVLSLKNMIIWEGLAWVALLLFGGIALMFYVVKEQKQSQKLRSFFASFTHDLKTSLTSLRLQAESLKEDLGTTSPLLPRLVADTVRIELQLENSLFLAHGKPQNLYCEPLKLSHLLANIEHNWPQVHIHLGKDMQIYGDARAISSILRNIIHNSVVHGQANQIFVESSEPHKLSLKDNGKGFSGDMSRLAQMFYRHTSSSGSGVGLYIASQLMASMKGKMSFPSTSEGFKVELEWKRT